MKRKPASARSSSVFTVESLDRRLLLSAVPTLVKDINPATDGSSPPDAVDVNGTLYFAASENGSGHENLWKSDGTPAGTVRVKDFNPSTPGAYSTLTLLTAVNDRLFFTAPDPDGTNNELWTSDGTDAGTHRVKDISPGNFSSDPYWLTSFNGSLYFTATTDSRGRELWKSDGTEAGTVRVRDIFPGANGS